MTADKDYKLRQYSTVSPIDGDVCSTVICESEQEIEDIVTKATNAFKVWRETSIEERVRYVHLMLEAFLSESDSIADELTLQIGRPIRYAKGEVNTFADRVRYMAEIAPQALASQVIERNENPKNIKRFLSRVPLGVVLVIPAWNYPYLTAVNGIVPAILAGNVVILKHSQQVPLCAEQMARAFKKAGLPAGVFQHLNADHQTVEKLVKHPSISFVNFTGSVKGGETIQQAAASSQKFIDCGLELGGKDAAYVRADAKLNVAAADLMDGAMFNSGQCCCGIERIYVHESVYDEFVDLFVEATKTLKLGDPRNHSTTLGPMVKLSQAELVREHIQDALEKGATVLIDASLFPEIILGKNYLAPQVLVNVNHSMKVMTEETFGPVVGIMKVKDDAEAVELMNDSQYGLTASIYTQDDDAAVSLGYQLDTGTVFQNRCDYVDPALAWTGVKNTGRGCTLSVEGFRQLTRPKSYHMKTI